MNRNPVKGDVVKIGRTQLLVIDGKMLVVEDTLRGDTHRCYQFLTIRETDCGKPNAKTKQYTLIGGDMAYDDMIDLKEIELVKSVKIKQSIV